MTLISEGMQETTLEDRTLIPEGMQETTLEDTPQIKKHLKKVFDLILDSYKREEFLFSTHIYVGDSDVYASNIRPRSKYDAGRVFNNGYAGYLNLFDI